VTRPVDNVINSGTIEGNIDLGRGNDSVENRGSLIGDVFLGLGDDTYVSDRHIAQGIIDGGEGYDIYRLDGENIALDFLTLTSEFNNMEEINITGSGDNSATLTLQNILNVTDLDNQLIISGNAGDSVTSPLQNWVLGDDQIIDGETYHTYTSGDATFLVDTDITQDIS